MAHVLCPVCKERVGGLLGKSVPYQRLEEEGKRLNVYQEHICLDCLKELVDEAKNVTPAPLAPAAAIGRAARRMFVSPSPVPSDGRDLGLVTGYCILGTGPFSALFSSVTDMFGVESNSYLKKARAAEEAAMTMMKVDAIRKGADAIYCVRVNLAEATSGNGMIMVSVQGAATLSAVPDQKILEVAKLLPQ